MDIHNITEKDIKTFLNEVNIKQFHREFLQGELSLRFLRYANSPQYTRKMHERKKEILVNAIKAHMERSAV